jgi:hypothetical protein
VILPYALNAGVIATVACANAEGTGQLPRTAPGWAAEAARDPHRRAPRDPKCARRGIRYLLPAPQFRGRRTPAAAVRDNRPQIQSRAARSPCGRAPRYRRGRHTTHAQTRFDIPGSHNSSAPFCGVP